MNAKRRERLARIESQLDALWQELDALVIEEDTAREAMPPAFCDAHDASLKASDEIQTAMDATGEARDTLANLRTEGHAALDGMRVKP